MGFELYPSGARREAIEALEGLIDGMDITHKTGPTTWEEVRVWIRAVITKMSAPRE